jgi:hypothetical protein
VVRVPDCRQAQAGFLTNAALIRALGIRSHACFGQSCSGIPPHGAKNGRSSVHGEEGAMPERAWSAKRERQYEHIKGGLKQRGDSEELAEEIAARTVNKERARHGESKTKSRSSTNDISSGRRGGPRSHRGAGGRTRDQLYEEAKRKGIAGRSKMTKAQLERAVDR